MMTAQHASRCRQLLQDPDTFATTLHAIILSVFGSDALYDDDEAGPALPPQELFELLESHFELELPETAKHKIQALQVAVEGDAFYHDYGALVAVCTALWSGDMDDVIDGVVTGISTPELMWSLYEVALNRDAPGVVSPFMKARLQLLLHSESDVLHDDAQDPAEEVQSMDSVLDQRKERLLAELVSIGADETMLRASMPAMESVLDSFA